MVKIRLITTAAVAAFTLALPAWTAAADLSTVTAQASASATLSGFDGVVEPVRQTVLAAQVPGAVIQLDVKVGDRVKAGKMLLRIDARAADQNAAASDAHRHQQLHPGRPLAQIIPGAVDEVGGPTILATLTVIAALLPMAFVSGLMGPYMSPIPINASMGMLLSLAIAFVGTPWLARLWMKAMPAHAAGAHGSSTGHGLGARLAPLFERVFRPLLDDQRGARNRRWLGLGIAVLIAISIALPATGLVLLKMLPFDNKSEFQVVVDMPAGTPLEQTAAVLHELGGYLGTVPEVTDYQAYAGTAAPINFNGLVRQYYLRSGGGWACRSSPS